MPLLNSKRSELSFIFPLFIGAIIGITFLYYFSAGVISNKKFEEFRGRICFKYGLHTDIFSTESDKCLKVKENGAFIKSLQTK